MEETFKNLKIEFKDVEDNSSIPKRHLLFTQGKFLIQDGFLIVRTNENKFYTFKLSTINEFKIDDNNNNKQIIN